MSLELNMTENYLISVNLRTNKFLASTNLRKSLRNRVGGANGQRFSEPLNLIIAQ